LQAGRIAHLIAHLAVLRRGAPGRGRRTERWHADEA